MEGINLNIICRLCAKEDRYCIEVFGEDGSKNRISKKIRLCLPITVREDDDYPKQICLSCLNKLDTSYELYSGCVNAQNSIKKLYKQVNRRKESSQDNLSRSPPIEQTNLIASEIHSLSRNRITKVGPTLVEFWKRKIIDTSKLVTVSTQTSMNDDNEIRTDSGNPENNDSDEDGDDYDNGADNMDVDFGEEMPMEQENLQIPALSLSVPNQNQNANLSKAGEIVVQTSSANQLTANQNFDLLQNNLSTRNENSPLVNNNLIQQIPVQIPSMQAQIYIPDETFKQGQNNLTLENLLGDTPHAQINQSQHLPQVQQANVNINITPPADVKQSKVAKKTYSKKKTNVVAPLSQHTGSPARKKKAVTATSEVGNARPNTVNNAVGMSSASRSSAKAQSKKKSNLAGIGKTNSVSGHSIRCRCSFCRQSKQGSANTTTTTAIRNSITSPTQASGMGQITNVRSAAPEFSQMENESTDTTATNDSMTNATPANETDSIPISSVQSTPVLTTTTTTATVDTKPTDASANTPGGPTGGTDEITIVDSPPGRNVESNYCKYCDKYFPADIFIHHRTLHFRSRFFCCVACGKNFRTEIGLENHRCDES